MDYIIREMKESESHLLNEFLYEAIYIPPGAGAPPKSIIDRPELQVYVAQFGKRYGDHALIAEIGGKAAGAIWARIMNDYGHVDEETPSLAIALYRPYRGGGIGTALMKAMLSLLREKGFRRASLAVQKANGALKLYRNTGFQIVAENQDEYIMVRYL